MKGTFLKGTLIITVGTILSKLLGSLFRIPLQNIAGDEVLGIFTLVYPLYMVALILSVAGIPLTISKLISEARVSGSETDIRNIFITSGILAFFFGVIACFFLFMFSRPLSILLGGPSVRYALVIVSLTLLIAPYMAVYRGFFQGFRDMVPTAVSQVIEQFVRVLLILLIAAYFVWLGASSQVVAGGVMVGSIAGAFLSLLYLRWLFVRSPYRPKSSQPYRWQHFQAWAKRILKLSLPIAFGSLTIALLNLVDSLTIPVSLTLHDGRVNVHHLYGLYGRGLAVVQVATVFATSLVLPLIPSVAESLAQGDRSQAGKVIAQSQKLNHFVSWPAAVWLFALAFPLNVALFGDGQETTVIALLGFSSLFQSFTVLGIGILQGIHLDKLAALLVVIGVFAKAVLNVLLVAAFGLIGAAWATIAVYLGLASVIAVIIHNRFRVQSFSTSTFVFAAVSVGIGGALGLARSWSGGFLTSRFGSLLYLAVALLAGVIIYFLLVIKWGGLKKEEFAGVPFVGRFVQRLFP